MDNAPCGGSEKFGSLGVNSVRVNRAMWSGHWDTAARHRNRSFAGIFWRGFGSFLGSAITHVSSVADRANTGHADQRAQSHGETVIPRRRAPAAIA
jgi:hypothetical protein